MKMLFVLMAVVLIVSPVAATTLIPTNGGTNLAPLTFTSSINTAALDPYAGTFYVGLAAGGATFVVSKALNTQSSVTPTFTAIGQNVTATNGIEFLTTVPIINQPVDLLAYVSSATNSFSRTYANIMTTDGASVSTSNTPLLDASGATGDDGDTTAGIVQLAARNGFLFTAVRPNGSSSPTVNAFGSYESGIAVSTISKVFNATTQTYTLNLTQTAAQPGDTGIKAALLDPSTAPVRVQNDPTIAANQANFYWDQGLQRLYTGLSVESAGTLVGDGAKSIVVGQLDTMGALTLLTFLPDGSLINGQTDAIVGVTDLASPLSVTARYPAVMHTSTGASYLIINGGNGSLDDTNNLVFALPLVDLGNPADGNQGVLANKNSFNSTRHRFETPVATNAELTKSTDSQAQVGAGPLPIEDITEIAALRVVGDAVYVSIATTQNSLNDTGIFYSQAIFDQTGKIIRWTPWSKRAFPFNGFPAASPVGGVGLFEVNPANGTIWAVGDTDNRAVRITRWDNGFNANDTSFTTPTSLPAVINQKMPKGSYSVLDLDQSTRGFVGATAYRYTLFGGANMVAIANVSTALGSAINSPQTVTTDYSLPTTFDVTQLPVGAGPVRTLEYSRQLTGSASNFFFAGTNTGLYVFASQTGGGFDVAQLNAVNAAPLSTYSWQKVTQIKESVIDIKTSGNVLYVMTSSSTKEQPFLNKIYAFPFTTNKNTMFASGRLIAQTATGSLANAQAFYGMQIIATAGDGSTEQLVVATNNGLYQSSRLGGVQAATNQVDALWHIIGGTQGSLFNYIGYMDNAQAPGTVWPLQLAPTTCGTFSESLINQLNGSADAIPFELVPNDFVSADPESPIVPQASTYFWSDGARRYFISVNTNPDFGGYNHLVILPFETLQSGVTNLADQFVDATVALNTQTFYWIRAIGATGIIMAGTNTGVIAFE